MGKIVSVLYGHGFGGGKLYSYNDPTGTRRVGQNIVVTVTHAKSKKDFQTLATVKSAHAAHTAGAEGTKSYLRNLGIRMKTLKGGLSQTELPGYYRGWGKDAKAQAELIADARVQAGNVLRFTVGGNLKSDMLIQQENNIRALRYQGVKFKNEDTWTPAQAKRYNSYQRWK
jgi:hypothetical protein